MGYVQKRVGRDGKPRYTAVYHDLRGERRSAGTFSSKKDANAAWQRAEAKTAEGRFNWSQARPDHRYRAPIAITSTPTRRRIKTSGSRDWSRAPV
jgi:hypothetical protein